MTPIKQDVKSLLESLPNDASIEDVQYHLYVMDKVRNGLDSIEREGGVSQEQVEARLSKWLIA